MKQRLACMLVCSFVFLANGCKMANPNYCGDTCLDAATEADPRTDALKNDAGTSESKSDSGIKYSDKDRDGATSDKDCDDNDSAVYPGAKEICDGKDNDCDGTVDNILTDTGAACGSTVGECQAGKISCVNGKLECKGYVGPQNELCDSKDNDCDGKTDEDFIDLGKACDVGEGACKKSGYYICNGSATKLKCDAASGTASVEGPPGNTNCYDNEDNDCDGLTDLSDTNCISCSSDADCDDGNKCTADSCVGGICKNTNVANGTSCSDGVYCNGVEACQSGTCTSGQKVLCDDGDACTSDKCNESKKACDYIAVTPSGTEGTPGGSTCLDGQDNDCDGYVDLLDLDCVECGNDLDCKGSNSCVNYACNSSKVCVSSNKTDGITCSDDTYCDGAETCQSGSCTAGTAISCNDSNACTADSCDETLDKCVYAAVSGCKSCVAASDCDDSNDCTIDACTGGKCANAAKADGASCDDGYYCTTGDACSGGTCAGMARDCSSYSDKCNTGSCDETNDTCKKTPKANSTSCSNGTYCDGNESCYNGSCQSGTAISCNDSDLCTTDTCDETQDKCVFTNTPVSGAEKWSISGTCTDGKDNDCDGFIDYADSDCRQCQYDSDCTDSNSCTKDTCNTTTYQCAHTNLTGTSCSDGKYCTTSDACSSGTCTGTSRDCSSYSDQCNTGSCDETNDTCKATPKTYGTSCTDGYYCTVNDYCDSNGTCVSGGNRNCGSGYTCSESQYQCIPPATSSGCADGMREGFTDSTVYTNIAGCSGGWSIAGLSSSGSCSGAGDDSSNPNGSGCAAVNLCQSGWHICTGATEVATKLPSGKNCTDVWSDTSDKRFFATLQPSKGFGYCDTSGTNDVFGCGNYGHPPVTNSCGKLNVFSSEDCSAIAYIGSTEVWRCGDSGDSSNELTTVIKLSYLGGGVLCCK